MSTPNSCTEISHPILLVDIFYSVLDCFRPEYSTEESQTLASLARTCRALSEPSLNRLWKTLRSFDPLIRCYAGNDLEHAIPPSSSQLAIIDRYARRVKELTVTGNTTLRFLQSTMMRAFPFPNLRILRWNPSNISPHIPITLVQPFLNQQLISLQLSFAEEDGPTLPSFFDDYLLCRSLKSFEVQFENKALSQTTAQALSNAICRQRYLENVVVNVPINDAALGHLSTLPTLKSLSVDLREASGQWTGSSSPTEPVFCNVEDLALETSDLELVTSLIQPHSQIFHSFRLNCNNRLTSEDMLTFLNVLASRPPTKPLHTLTLTCGSLSFPMPVDRMTSEAPHYYLSYKTLQPLVAFGFLRHLRITWSEQFSLDDVELANLVSNWPLLKEFHITCSRGSYPPFLTKYPTLGSLLALISSCPEIQSITLPLDATHVPEFEEIEPFEHLESLAVPESPIDQPLPVAQFLFHLFPSLEMLDARYEYLPGTNYEQLMAYDGAWQRVQDHIEELHGFPPEYCSYDSDSDDDEPEGFLIMGA